MTIFKAKAINSTVCQIMVLTWPLNTTFKTIISEKKNNFIQQGEITGPYKRNAPCC